MSGPQLDIDSIEAKWLQQCGPCDGGLATSCTHPDGDYRAPLAAACREVRQLRAERDAADEKYALVAAYRDQVEPELRRLRQALAAVEALCDRAATQSGTRGLVLTVPVSKIRRALGAAVTPTVEIGGQAMTQAQFDAARHPLLADGSEVAALGDEMSVSFAAVTPTPTGPGERCLDCGRAYADTPWRAADALFVAVIGSDAGMYCPSCFGVRAAAAGFEIEYWVPTPWPVTSTPEAATEATEKECPDFHFQAHGPHIWNNGYHVCYGWPRNTTLTPSRPATELQRATEQRPQFVSGGRDGRCTRPQWCVCEPFDRSNCRWLAAVVGGTATPADQPEPT